MRGVYWHTDEISRSQVGVCYIELLDELVVDKEVKLSLRLTMHHDGNMYVGNGVVLHNLSLGN